ncbi:MAG: hypothetical protein JRI58_14170 [Deltaproteobacteria bacterium]|nr:hypothetical protein [Deltaproteobacteria bacterium]MBW2009756.1 hypothetical protein [Deltaproteobacteria bacterium]MBW2075863.1 hypothetical protein [Deltaproteobacteria bacterium]
MATPDYECLDRIRSVVWLYVYATVRFRGIEMAIFLFMAFFLGAAFRAENLGKPKK